MGGLCHGVERAIASDSDHGSTGGDGERRSLVRNPRQIGRVAKQQLALAPGSLQCGFNDLAFCVRITATRCRIDDKLEWRRGVYVRAGEHGLSIFSPIGNLYPKGDQKNPHHDECNHNFGHHTQ